eukprot:gene11415-13304_t
MDEIYGIKIYVDHNKTTIKGINIQKNLVKFLLNIGVHGSLISVYDIANNFEKQGAIKTHSKKIPKYPYVEINGQLWGEGWSVEEKREEIIELIQPLLNIVPEERSVVVDSFMGDTELDKNQIPTDTLQLGYIDSGINITEWLLFGIVKGFWNSTWQTSATPEPEPCDFECDAIRTNWYGRHQFRRYRFTPSEFYRIQDGVVKATLYYKDVKELICTDKKNIILKFEGTEDQYIEATEKDIAKIIEIIQSRAYLSPNGENNWISPMNV